MPGIGSRDGNPNVGGKSEFVGVPYDFGNNSVLAHLNTSYYHIHGIPFCYPTLADDVAVTSGAGSWGTGGALTEIIPSGTLVTSAFDLHWINITNHSEDAYFYLEIYAGEPGSEILIGCTRNWRDSAFFGGSTGANTKRIQIPQQLPGTRISVKLYSSNVDAATVQISFEGHFYA